MGVYRLGVGGHRRGVMRYLRAATGRTHFMGGHPDLRLLEQSTNALVEASDMNHQSISCLQRGVAGLLIGAFLLATPAVAFAAPPLVTDASQVPEEEAKELAETAATYYGSNEYSQAGMAFGNALDALPASKPNMRARMRLVIDAMTAYREAAKVSKNMADLQAGDAVYKKYLAAYQAAYGNPNVPAAVTQSYRALQADMRRMQNPSGSSSGKPSSGKKKSGTPLLAAGGVLLAGGVGTAILAAAGAVGARNAEEDSRGVEDGTPEADDIRSRGQRSNALLVTGAILTPILIGTGSALLAVGAKRNKSRGRRAMAVPVFDGDMAGMTVTGRF